MASIVPASSTIGPKDYVFKPKSEPEVELKELSSTKHHERKIPKCLVVQCLQELTLKQWRILVSGVDSSNDGSERKDCCAIKVTQL